MNSCDRINRVCQFLLVGFHTDENLILIQSIMPLESPSAYDVSIIVVCFLDNNKVSFVAFCDGEAEGVVGSLLMLGCIK